jgi:hypothetical protein
MSISVKIFCRISSCKYDFINRVYHPTEDIAFSLPVMATTLTLVRHKLQLMEYPTQFKKVNLGQINLSHSPTYFGPAVISSGRTVNFNERYQN